MRAHRARGRHAIVAALVLVGSAVDGLVCGARFGAPPAAPKGPLVSRFYGGVDVAAVHYDDKYADIAFGGSSIGLGLYTGFRVNDHLSVELAYDGADAIDKHNVAGSGIVYFNVETELRTLSCERASGNSRFATCSICRATGSVYAMFGLLRHQARPDGDRSRVVRAER